jgi:hypothetical protein
MWYFAASRTRQSELFVCGYFFALFGNECYYFIRKKALADLKNGRLFLKGACSGYEPGELHRPSLCRGMELRRVI